MATPYAVEQFISDCLANGTWTIESRDRLWAMAETGASAVNLYSYLAARGYEKGYDSVNNWRLARFGSGSLAMEINQIARQARGLAGVDNLDLIASWMLHMGSKVHEAVKDRQDWNQLSTKELISLLSVISPKILAAIAESQKIRALADNRDLLEGMAEQMRVTAKKLYEDSPEAIPLVENVIEVFRAQFDESKK